MGKFEKLYTDQKAENDQLQLEKKKLFFDFQEYKSIAEMELAQKRQRITFLEAELKKKEDTINEYVLEKNALLKAKENESQANQLQIRQLRTLYDTEKVKAEALASENLDLRKKLGLVTAEKEVIQSTMSQTIENLKKQVDVMEFKSDFTPSLSIHMNSLLSLNKPDAGWLLKSPDYEQLNTVKNKKLIMIAVIGMYDVGKSWFCNNFAKKKLLASGYTQTTHSLDFVFPSESEGSSIGIIDTPGSNEAIRVTDEKLIQMLEPYEEQSNKKNLEQLYFSRYTKLKNDAKIIQDLKERFIREITDVLVLICNKLSEKEQEILYKVIKHHKEVAKQRMQEAFESKKEQRDTNLYIIHNYKNIAEIDQVKQQMEKDLMKSFKVETIPMFSQEKPEFKDLNNLIYFDQFGITHLILAQDGSVAGNYFNQTTFAYLKEKLNTMSQRTQVDVGRFFLDFCNRNLPNLLKQDIKLKFNKDQTAIIKDGDSKSIVLENLHYDEFGNFYFSSTDFEPRYSIEEKPLEPGKKDITVEIEVVDSEFKANYLKGPEGMYVLQIEGKKHVNLGVDLNTGAKYQNHNREWGDFQIKIPLSNENLVSVSKEPKQGTKSGIMRYTFTFEKLQAVEI